MLVAGAAEFAVDTNIYSGDQAEPTSGHRILFLDGSAYHFTAAGLPLAVYDSKAAQVTLLDRRAEVQTVVHLDDLLRITAEAKSSVEEPAEQRRLGIAADVVADQNTYQVEFGGISYRAETEPPDDPAVASDYGRFADLALRMNILRPAGPPPFARLKLNRQLVAQGEIPVASTMTIENGDQQASFRSTNRFGDLNESDRQRIERTETMLREFRQVPLDEFPSPSS